MRLAAWVLGASVLFAQQNAQDRAAWNQPVEPFQIIGNVYYVGMRGVSSFLIDTPAGAILLDGGFPESVPLIVKNIAALHFSIGEVRILINSHAHYDHSGGLAALKTCHLDGSRRVRVTLLCSSEAAASTTRLRSKWTKSFPTAELWN